MKTHIINKNLSSADYHVMYGLNASLMKALLKSPAHYKIAQEDGFKKTEAMTFGELLHLIVLEPHKVKDEVAVMPEIDRRTKIGKEQYELFVIENDGKLIVKKDDMERAEAMRQSILANKKAAKLINAQGMVEVSLFWNDNHGDFNLNFKARLDKVLENGIIIDLKSTTSIDPDDFQRTALKYGYHISTAQYLEAVEKCLGKRVGKIFIACEKDPPHRCRIFQASEEFIEIGKMERKRAIEKFIECNKKNDWTFNDEEVHTLGVPSFAYSKYFDLEEVNNE